MTKHTPIRAGGSTIERAAEQWGLARVLGSAPPLRLPPEVPAAQAPAPAATSAPALAPAPVAALRSLSPARPQGPRTPTRVAAIDLERLAARKLIVPGGPVTQQSEEFRFVKRQLLLAARGGKGQAARPRGERILIASAAPGEGKSWTALNLALSMAAERDDRVLLVDADFAKPSICAELGIEPGPGLMDALAEPSLDVEELVIGTSVPGLSVLPSGARTGADTEYVASARSEQLLERLTEADPTRIMIFDSPPLLAASPASVLALHVGQVVMVVRADRTSEAMLADALRLIGGEAEVRLLLNDATLSQGTERFGAYHGYGEV